MELTLEELEALEPGSYTLLDLRSEQETAYGTIPGSVPANAAALPEGLPAEPAQQLIGKTPNQIRKAGVAMAFVPEDRLGMGLVGSMGMGSNMMLRSWRKGKGAFVNRRDPNKLAMEVMEELEVVTPSISTPVRRLSGGNVQKVLVGREIAMSPSVLLTAYAVRGLGSELEPNMTASTKKNLAWRVECEFGATAGKVELAKVAKKNNLDAIHDTVHEMARDEARHGKALKGLLERYFG